MQYMIPVLFVALFAYCLIKNIPAYDNFVKGTSGAIDLAISILPFLVAIFIFVELMNVSGVSAWLSRQVSPLLKFVALLPFLFIW